MARKIIAAVAAAFVSMAANAAPADHYSVADLTKMMGALKTQAANGGAASTTLATYSGHHTMLAYRNRDGAGELHQHYADIFYIVRGKATLVTEGKLIDSKEDTAGELRGSGVADGTTTELEAGDVVHIPAGTPHQLKIAKGSELLYFVVKIKE